MSATPDFVAILQQTFGQEAVIETQNHKGQLVIQVSVAQWPAIATFLQSNSACYFDSLSCLTAIDNGLTANTMELIYQLYSIPYHQSLGIKIKVSRENPVAPSVVATWRTADWHEREAFDMFGIVFDNHPDLRRILMPADWEGFPLRKDYQPQEIYHDIKVKY